MLNSHQYSREVQNRHLDPYLKSEGIDSDFFYHELNNKNTPEKTISGILAHFAKLISTPLDWTAKKSTELLLPLLISLKEKRGVNLNEISLELTRQIFPEEILSKLDKLSPGIALRWETELKILTDSLIYAPFRVIQASFLEGLFTGIVASSGSSFAAIGFLRVLINAMTESVLVFSDQDFNRLWGMTQALAADIRIALEGSRGVVNADKIVDQILSGYQAELQYDLLNTRIWSMLVGLSLGSGISVATEVVATNRLSFNAEKTAILGGIGSILIWFFGKKLPENLLQDVSSQFGQIQANIVSATSEAERWALATNDLTSNDPRLKELSENRQATTLQKNLSNNLTGSAGSALVASLMQEIGLSNIASSSFLISALLGEILNRNLSYMSHKSKLIQRQHALKSLNGILDLLLGGDRAPLTNEHLKTWLKAEDSTQLECFTDLNLTLKSVGNPIYTRGIDRKRIQAISFSAGFTIQSGQIVVVEGGNGSGKTTLLKTLCGIHVGNLDNTKAMINQRDIRTISAEQRKGIFVYFSGMSEQLDLRTLVVKVFNKYGLAEKYNISRSRLASFIGGKADEEIEKIITDHFVNMAIFSDFNKSWFDVDRKLSGAERSMFEIGLYLLVDRPLIITVDEIGGSLTGNNYQKIVDVLCRNISQSKHILIVGVNKDYFRWYRQQEVVGWIRMNDGIQGKMIKDKLVQEEDREYVSLMRSISRGIGEATFDSELIATPKDFRTWVTWGPAFDEKEKLKQFIDEGGWKRPNNVGVVQASNILNFELGERGKYTQRCAKNWLDKLEKMGEAEKLQFGLDILFALNSFYGIERQILTGFHRRYHGEEPICNQWDVSLINKFNIVFGPLLKEAYQIRTEALNIGDLANYPEKAELAENFIDAYYYWIDMGGDTAEGIQDHFIDSPSSEKYTILSGNALFKPINDVGTDVEKIFTQFCNVFRHPSYQKKMFMYKWFREEFIKYFETSAIQFNLDQIDGLLSIIKAIKIARPWGDMISFWEWFDSDKKISTMFDRMKLANISDN